VVSRNRGGRVRRWAPVLGAVAAASVVLTGCGLTGGLTLRTAADLTAASLAKISMSPVPSGAAHLINPGDALIVTVTAGRLTQVSVTGPDGAVPGELSADRSTWTGNGDALEYDTSYRLTANAVDRLGNPTRFTEAFKTIRPTKFLSVERVNPSGTATVGIGIPMKVTLSRGVSDPAERTKLESHLSVSINGRVTTAGGWRWDSDHVVEYRLPSYWPGNSTIALTADIKGVNFGGGIFGRNNSTHRWTTGPAMISYVNLKTDEMKVTQDGKVLRTIPITGGKEGFTTRSGIKVILEKDLSHRMNAASGGTPVNSPDYYNIVVQYAMRVTWSGEFLHAAPWSQGSQGSANVSHGCVGMSTSNAEWYYNHSEIGDVVVVTGSDRFMTMDNGIGDWNVPFARWVAGYDS
jgi:lipoprotein-anchoring transpeptidase ErfK/SrfK